MTEHYNGSHYSDKGGHRIRSKHWQRIRELEATTGPLYFQTRSEPNLANLLLTSEKKKKRFTGGNSPKRPAGPGSPYKPLF